MSGPLHGIRIVEMGGIGPGPFAAMMLADHGADIIRVTRPGNEDDVDHDVLLRSRGTVCADLKTAEGIALVRDLARSADGLIEGFRPGVMERLGLGPDVLQQINPDLVYGRMTGWGQTGPMAARAGHDINYIALSGALAAFGRAGGPPVPPINMVGDFGGGGMMLAFGMLAALLHVRGGGKAQVIDCAMTDGSALLMAMMWGYRRMGIWGDDRGTNLLDTGAPFYDVHATADGKWVALGAVEPQFYAAFLDKAGLSGDPAFGDHLDPSRWAALRPKIAAAIAGKTRDEWCALMDGVDGCLVPVLDYDEAASHPHNVERTTFVEVDGMTQPGPCPRFSGSIGKAPYRGADPDRTGQALARFGIEPERIAALRNAGAIA